MAEEYYNAQLIGANKLRKRLDLKGLALKPLRDYYGATALVVRNKSRREAPRDTGRIRKAITFKPLGTRGRLPAGISVYVDQQQAPYAPFVHGYMRENFRQSPPFDRTKPHFPPVSALTGWSERRGLNPYAVAKSIARKGTPIIPFLKMGFHKSRNERRLLLVKAHRDIERQWKKGKKKVG